MQCEQRAVSAEERHRHGAAIYIGFIASTLQVLKTAMFKSETRVSFPAVSRFV